MFRGDPPRLVLAVALVLVGVVLWQLAAGIRGGADDEAATTSSTAAVQEFDAAQLDGGWVRADLPGRAPMDHVSVVDAALYASGWNPVERQSEMWRSNDGLEWQRVPDPDGAFADAVVNDVVSLDGLVVAVGARNVGEGLEESVSPAVWRSTDGSTFTRIADELIEGWDDAGSEAGILSAAVSGGRIVAVGWHTSGSLVGADEGSRGAVWVSDLGDSWSRALSSPDALGGPGTAVLDVEGRSDGGFIAVGRSVGRAAIWESQTGEDWRSSAVPSGAFAGEGDWSGLDVAATDQRTVVLGRAATESGDVEPRLWATADEGWEPMTIPELAAIQLGAVAELSPGFVATGRFELPDGRRATGMWASADGADWTRVDIDGTPVDVAEIRDVINHPAGLVAVGELYEQPAVWALSRAEGESVVAAGAPLPPPAWATIFQEQEPSESAPERVLVAGELQFGFSGDVVWTSPDGRGWTPSTLEGAGFEGVDRVDSMAFADGLYVAVAVSEDRTGLWVSDDGLAWRQPAKAPPCCIAAVFESTGGGFHALGQDPADAGWFLATSSDGSTWSVSPELPRLSAETIRASTRLGGTDIVWTRSEQVTEAWASGNGIDWVPVEGLGVTVWRDMWFTSDNAYASVVTADGVGLIRTNGVTWEQVPIDGMDTSGATIVGVGEVNEGLAVVVNQPGRPLRLYQMFGGAAPAEIPLTGTLGFGGLRAVVAPEGPQLRVIGPEHGRMTVWEWVPAE